MKRFARFTVLAGALLLASNPALAKEGGDQYPNGSEGWGAGDLPPAGTYFINYALYYSGALKDRAGNGAKLAGSTPKVEAVADAFRIVQMTDIKILGATYGFSMIVPVVHQDVNIAALGGDHSMAAVGDITITPVILSWHRSDWQFAAALDINAPTGAYNEGGLGANGLNTSDPRKDVGANYWSFEPLLAATYRTQDGWELSSKFMLNVKTENTYTRYQSGSEFHFDYLIGKSFGAWGLGLGGYYLAQLSNDTQGGSTVTSRAYFGQDGVFADGRKGQVFAVGPSVRYRTESGHMLMLTWHHESVVENRFGGDKVLLKFVTGL